MMMGILIEIPGTLLRNFREAFPDCLFELPVVCLDQYAQYVAGGFLRRVRIMEPEI